MFDIVKISLENAMDLILAHKKAARLGERIKLTISTTTTFSTAVVEVCREVIDRTDTGTLYLGLKQQDRRFSLTAKIVYAQDITINGSDLGYQNALKLLPEVKQYSDNKCEVIELSIGLPRSCNINPEVIRNLRSQFLLEPPYTAYEALKNKNLALHEIAEKSEVALQVAESENELKNEFISMASHELKTPVTIIKAYSQLALAASEEKCSPDVKKHLARIEAQSIKLTSLIQQLLDVSKIESGKLEYNMINTDLNTFLTDSISQVKFIVPDNQLEVNLGETVKLNLDTLRIEQVLSNVIGNASKYSKFKSKIRVNSRLDGNKAIVSVIDEGIGMSEENTLGIFDKFHRNPNVLNKYSGLGMGLYISSKIVKEHGGQMWVKSVEGEGSIFSFSLPFE